MKSFTTLILLSAMLLLACSKTSTPTASNNTTTPIDSLGKIFVSVDGVNYTMGVGMAVRNAIGGKPGIRISVPDSGTSGKNVVINLTYVSTTGTYTIGGDSAALSFGFSDATGNSILYTSSLVPNSKMGSITISSITTSTVAGSFSATIPISTGATSSPQSVTISGRFTLNFFA